MLIDVYGDAPRIVAAAYAELMGSAPPAVTQAVVEKSIATNEATPVVVHSPSTKALASLPKQICDIPQAEVKHSKPTDSRNETITCGICKQQFPKSSAAWFFGDHVKVCSTQVSRLNSTNQFSKSCKPASWSKQGLSNTPTTPNTFVNPVPLIGLGAVSPAGSSSRSTTPVSAGQPTQHTTKQESEKEQATPVAGSSKGGLMGSSKWANPTYAPLQHANGGWNRSDKEGQVKSESTDQGYDIALL